MLHIVLKHPFSLLLIVGIWVLCFIDIPETPLNNVTLMDKWTHIIMYLVLSTTIILEHRRYDHTASTCRLLVLAWLLPILMSALIEYLQATCTNGHRSGDWLDLLANSIGSSLALLGIKILRNQKK